MTPSNTFGRTIQLFLGDGTPKGLRKAMIHCWTGLFFVATTSTLGALTSPKEFDRTGIYLLAGPDPDHEGGTRAYIGSANSVQERIKQGDVQRDFWEIAVAVKTSDDDLSKGHIQYLEARLIELATRAKRFALDIGNNPASQRRRLPEADQANMEQFLSNLKIMLPVVGLDLLKPQPRAAPLVSTPVEQRTSSEVKFQMRHRTGVQAQEVEEMRELIVIEGSQAQIITDHVQQSYGGLKRKPIDQGVLAPSTDNLLVFAKPHAFSSPSAAATVVLYKNSNGRIEWKVQGSKQSYHDWQQTWIAADGAGA